jgi:hypothetical protein
MSENMQRGLRHLHHENKLQLLLTHLHSFRRTRPCPKVKLHALGEG